MYWQLMSKVNYVQKPMYMSLHIPVVKGNAHPDARCSALSPFLGTNPTQCYDNSIPAHTVTCTMCDMIISPQINNFFRQARLADAI
jgi:hypothetical protein